VWRVPSWFCPGSVGEFSDACCRRPDPGLSRFKTYPRAYTRRPSDKTRANERPTTTQFVLVVLGSVRLAENMVSTDGDDEEF
jgi:hypothetical protein